MRQRPVETTTGRSVPWHRRAVRLSGVLLLGGYLSWNVWWLIQGRLAPSIFKAMTGLPCPTTGGTRSLVALCRGDMVGSLYFNPMTLPILVMMVVTLTSIGLRVMRRQKLVLAGWHMRAWLVLLLIAWVAKLAGPSGAW